MSHPVFTTFSSLSLSQLFSYRTYPSDAPAQLTAGVTITQKATEPVKDERIRSLLPERSRDNIVQVKTPGEGEGER